MGGQKHKVRLEGTEGGGNWGRSVEVQAVVGLFLLGSAFPSLPMEAGRREASEKLWGRCGTELRAPRPFP